MSIPDSVRKTLDDMAQTFDRKNADYATGSRPWTNFEESAAQVNQTPSDVVETLIAVKQSRLKQLRGGKTPRNESVRDTLLDRAVYSVIALAMYDEDAQDLTQGFEPIEDEWSDFERRNIVYTRIEDMGWTPMGFADGGGIEYEWNDDEKILTSRELGVSHSKLKIDEGLSEDAREQAARYADEGVDFAWQDAHIREAVEFETAIPTNGWEGSFDLLGGPIEGLWNVFEEATAVRPGAAKLRWQVAPDGQIWHDNGKSYGDGLDTFNSRQLFTFVGAYVEPVWAVQHEDFPGFLENLEWNDGGKDFARKLLEQGKTVVIGNNGYTYTFEDSETAAECTRPDGSYAGFGFTLDRLSNDDNKIVGITHS